MIRSEPRPSCDRTQPWDWLPMPPLRSGPPYLMAESIEHEPELAQRLATDPALAHDADALAALLRTGSDTGWPPVVVGCGTSEHAAMAAASIWRTAWRAQGLAGSGPLARQAFEAALDPWPGVLVGVSHEGGTRATIDAMVAARGAGARVALVTAGANGPAGSVADVCLCTGDTDLSWCHTIPYVGPIVAATLVADRLAGTATTPGALRAPLDAGLASADACVALARELASSRVLVVVGSGNDRIAGREMALKVEEAAYVPTVYRDLETMLHGHIPSLDVGSGLVLILTHRDHRAERAARARQLLAAVGHVGVRAGAILTAPAAEAVPEALTPAGRVVVPDPEGLQDAAAALLASAVPLQLTTYHLALALGTNPDVLRREFRPYRAAAAAAEEEPAAGAAAGTGPGSGPVEG